MPNVDIPGVGVVEFPASTPDSTIQRVAAQKFMESQIAQGQHAPPPNDQPGNMSPGFFDPVEIAGGLAGSGIAALGANATGPAMDALFAGARGFGGMAMQGAERAASVIGKFAGTRLGQAMIHGATETLPGPARGVVRGVQAYARTAPAAVEAAAPAVSQAAAPVAEAAAPAVEAAAAPAAEAGSGFTKGYADYARKRAMALLDQAGVPKGVEESRAYISKVIGRTIKSRSELTPTEWETVHDSAESLLRAQSAEKYAAGKAASIAKGAAKVTKLPATVTRRIAAAKATAPGDMASLLKKSIDIGTEMEKRGLSPQDRALAFKLLREQGGH